jgi:hypothetical protein
LWLIQNPPFKNLHVWADIVSVIISYDSARIYSDWMNLEVHQAFDEYLLGIMESKSLMYEMFEGSKGEIRNFILIHWPTVKEDKGTYNDL